MKAIRFFLAGLALVCTACTNKAPLNATVGHINLPRFMGQWHVVARIDNPTESHFADPTQTFALKSDQKIDMAFAWRDDSAEGAAKERHYTGTIFDTGGNAVWEIRETPFTTVRYEIIGLDPYYRWAVAANRSHDMAWVLSRRPRLSESDYRSAEDVLWRQNYDTQKLVRLKQD
jgi:apolipoprotein D and lipocalin family protein